MDILVVGGGGREHAIVMKLAESPKVESFTAHPETVAFHAMQNVLMLRQQISRALWLWQRSLKVDMVAVAPDDPLVLGMVDALQAEGFKTFGPKKNAAIIEGSKVFLRIL